MARKPTRIVLDAQPDEVKQFTGMFPVVKFDRAKSATVKRTATARSSYSDELRALTKAVNERGVRTGPNNVAAVERAVRELIGDAKLNASALGKLLTKDGTPDEQVIAHAKAASSEAARGYLTPKRVGAVLTVWADQLAK
jgi:hypothetical protein